MASIRYRAPWRVIVNGKTDPKGPFASEKQAQAYAATLAAQGIDKDSIKVAQERSGTWEVRIRRHGGKVLIKSFPTKKMASDWADEREGEIVIGTFVDTRVADKWTVGELLQRYADNCIKPGVGADRKLSQWLRFGSARTAQGLTTTHPPQVAVPHLQRHITRQEDMRCSAPGGRANLKLRGLQSQATQEVNPQCPGGLPGAGGSGLEAHTALQRVRQQALQRPGQKWPAQPFAGDHASNQGYTQCKHGDARAKLGAHMARHVMLPSQRRRAGALSRCIPPPYRTGPLFDGAQAHSSVATAPGAFRVQASRVTPVAVLKITNPAPGPQPLRCALPHGW